jgi:hypothetical protein
MTQLNNARQTVTAMSLIVLTSLTLSTAKADEWNKKTILTINEPIQVRECYLAPGQYVFKLVNSPSDRHIVQIFNADESRIIDTELAIPNYRLEPTGKSRFTFYETPAGHLKAMRAWFYPGDNFGQEFPYPQHLQTVVAETAAVMMPQPEPPAAVAVAEAAPAETPAPVEAAPVETAPVAEAPVVTPDAAPVEQPQDSSTPSQTAAPTTLPKTASQVPLFGLAGLMSLGIYLLLRPKTA